MYLINTETYELHLFKNIDGAPPYAILSHVWGANEQTFEETPLVRQGKRKRGVLRRVCDRAFRPPSKKIKGACDRARRDHFRWLWADAACIDAANSTELGETINSFFKLYARAAMCYAYLADVPPGADAHAPRSAFRRSRWFRRAWTLQELIAPHSVIFLAADWSAIGAKRTLAALIETVTGVDRAVLTHKRALADVSVARRMSWAARRQATREEDLAYALMGVFDVYMTPIYGEGAHAFVRLQEAIVRRSPDQSVFAWGRALRHYHSGSVVAHAREHDYEGLEDTQLLFASSPRDFAHSADITPVPQEQFAAMLGWDKPVVPVYTMTSAGVQTRFPVVAVKQTAHTYKSLLGLLACVDRDGGLVALFLRPHANMSNQMYVGGFVARGRRRNNYYRTTRLSTSEDRCLIASASPEDMFIHYSRPGSSRTHSSASAASSAASARPRSSLIFFEPPCTIALSRASVAQLHAMGYVVPVVPRVGFRLGAPGEARSVSFVGYESFTVHFGVCAVELGPGATQRAQLWAAVVFDNDADPASLLAPVADPEHFERGAGTGDVLGSDVHSGGGAVRPDESMLVQGWKDHRRCFGDRDREVRLTFSYPCEAARSTDKGMSEVYELEIAFRRGYYSHEAGRRRLKDGVTSYSVSTYSGKVESVL